MPKRNEAEMSSQLLMNLNLMQLSKSKFLNFLFISRNASFFPLKHFSHILSVYFLEALSIDDCLSHYFKCSKGFFCSGFDLAENTFNEFLL